VGKGKILRVRVGYNPNSSAESMVVGFAIMGGSVLVSLVAGIMNAFIIHRRRRGQAQPEDQT
jgi:hypothetical protein